MTRRRRRSPRARPAPPLGRARQRYLDALRAQRLALIAAAPALRVRARRRSAAVRLFALAAVVGAAGLLIAAGLDLRARSAAQDQLDEAAAVRAAAITAVTTMLTPDPARAGEYVPGLLEVTTGEQRDRIGVVAGQLTDVAAALERPAAATVLSAGVLSVSGDDARLVLVAEASDPQLVGADSDSSGASGSSDRGDGSAGSRITLRVDMHRVDGRWLVALAEAVE